ncbi:MAG: DUF2191 domain-containing protein [Acidobacteria bacterium]|nr:DUF2191 domain-containing protein [Acidobacteriota bacterium]MYJ04456.1 DUF2191 domain-containing protein [Acidobacteriota bacterium]
MRTTIRLADSLLLEAKREAARCGVTLTAIIEESLRARLARTRHEPRVRVKLTTTGRGGLRPGVDLDDSASLLDVMDGAE